MKMKVKTRMFLSFGILNILIIVLGIYAGLSLKTINLKTTEIATKWLTGVRLAEKISALASDYRVKQYQHIVSTNEDEMIPIEQEMAEINKLIDQEKRVYEANIYNDEDRALFNKALSEWNRYLKNSQELINYSRQLNPYKAMTLMRGESNTAFLNMSKDLNNLVAFNQTHGEQASSEATAIYAKNKALLIVLIVISIIIALITAYYLSRNILDRLNKLYTLTNRMLEGDLTEQDINVRNLDEIGNLAIAFNHMKNNLKKMIKKLTLSAKDLADTSLNLSSQTQETAAAASENAATVEEIAATIDQVAVNAQNVSAASRQIALNASNGVTGIERIIDQMNLISSSSEKATAVINNLSNTLVKVTEILELISHITDQTNLLALNAAIEAARAGEYGRGFTVVADEVRRLAEQSAKAAKEISQLVNKVQTESTIAVEVISAGNTEVRDGVKVVSEVGGNLKEIMSMIEGLTEQVQNVAVAAEQVTAGVQNVASTTEEQTAATEEVAAAAETLTRMAQDINKLTGSFRIDI